MSGRITTVHRWTHSLKSARTWMSTYRRIAVVHCLAGKGRTGTVIACYLLYSGRFTNAQQALAYYSKKRFSEGEGVTQPCQRRYVLYFEEVLNHHRNGQQVISGIKTLRAVRMVGVPNFSTIGGCRPFVEVYTVADKQMIYSSKNQTSNTTEHSLEEHRELLIDFGNKVKVVGDVLIKLLHNGRVTDSFICRWAFNTSFVGDSLMLGINDLDPDSTKSDTRFPKNFTIETIFEDLKHGEDYNISVAIFLREEESWEKIYAILKQYKPRRLEESQILLFGDPETDDVDRLTIRYRVTTQTTQNSF
eukprot:TRINITY_DN8932_c0_g1_i4.p1 TRINITY_DN8932_c0_g1~~TRINITY_DN8932_c0_g1_i4.p1  ORF type:complete len:304 (-),score=13.43 TRINITY_DN8932_c0_g1_i4:219-1130(-)